MRIVTKLYEQWIYRQESSKKTGLCTVTGANYCRGQYIIKGKQILNL